MLAEPWPIERRAALALAPSRFLVRDLRRPNGIEREPRNRMKGSM
jgi:hypothetical protein